MHSLGSSIPLFCVLLLACGDDGGATGGTDGGTGGTDGGTDGGTGGTDGGTGGSTGLIAEPFAVAVQGERLLVAGGYEGDAFVARFFVDGRIDASFGVDGIRRVDFGGPETPFRRQEDVAYALLVRPNAIVIAGAVRGLVPGAGVFGLARLTGDGALDETFGNGGIRITDTGDDNSSRWNQIFADDAGRLYAVGGLYNGVSRGQDIVVARYSADGPIDVDFRTPGSTGAGVIWDGGSQEEWGIAGALLADGVVAGGGPAGFRVTKFDLSGALVPSFGTGGVFRDEGGVLFAIRPQEDGGLLLIGTAPPPADGEPTNGFKLVRLDVDGALVPSFGEGGRLIVRWDLTLIEFPDGQTLSGGFNTVRGVAFAPDGDVLVHSAILGITPVVARIDPATGAAVDSF
ncbi:MAG: hypothetical protein HC923_04855, partial [Myxococcales bacterium]|nr:hypothetical protein [Myxococcales bacterium]